MLVDSISECTQVTEVAVLQLLQCGWQLKCLYVSKLSLSAEVKRMHKCNIVQVNNTYIVIVNILYLLSTNECLQNTEYIDS